MAAKEKTPRVELHNLRTDPEPEARAVDAFCVKNGSNTFVETSINMPLPRVRDTKKQTLSFVAQSVVSRLRIRRRPTQGMASMALPTRLFKTCRMSPSKQRAGGWKGHAFYDYA
jgi:hypothetical protein